MRDTPRLVRNALRTPDGSIIRSRFTHDYVTHVDANGKEYMIDGGNDYCRRSIHGDEEMLLVYSSDTHDIKREAVQWGTFGIKGDQPMRYISVGEMDTAHITTVLKEYGHRLHPDMVQVMTDELNIRAKKEISDT